MNLFICSETLSIKCVLHQKQHEWKGIKCSPKSSSPGPNMDQFLLSSLSDN